MADPIARITSGDRRIDITPEPGASLPIRVTIAGVGRDERHCCLSPLGARQLVSALLWAVDAAEGRQRAGEAT